MCGENISLTVFSFLLPDVLGARDLVVVYGRESGGHRGSGQQAADDGIRVPCPLLPGPHFDTFFAHKF